MENYTKEEALGLVRDLLFPEAKNGETVKQFGHWFIMENNQWEHCENPPEEG